MAVTGRTAPRELGARREEAFRGVSHGVGWSWTVAEEADLDGPEPTNWPPPSELFSGGLRAPGARPGRHSQSEATDDRRQN
jgi:hypothetical protein